MKERGARATAYHEAAHFVAVCMRRLKPVSVSIVPNPDAGEAGRCSYSIDWGRQQLAEYDEALGDKDYDRVSYRMRERIESLIIVSLAGAAADSRQSTLKRHYTYYLRRGSYSDLTASKEAAAMIISDPEEQDAFLDWMWIRAQNLVAGHWDMVKRLANTLMEHRELSARQAREVVFLEG